MQTLILDRSSSQTLMAFQGETLTLDGRDDAWVSKLNTWLKGRRPEALAVGLGPGSFAGIRAAIACLQGLGIGWGLKPRGFPSAAVLALASGLPQVTVIGDARRNTLWSVRFSVTEDAITQEGPFRILEREGFTATPDMVSPDAARLAAFNLRAVQPTAELLEETVRRMQGALVDDPLPFYLHPAVGAAHAEPSR